MNHLNASPKAKTVELLDKGLTTKLFTNKSKTHRQSSVPGDIDQDCLPEMRKFQPVLACSFRHHKFFKHFMLGKHILLVGKQLLLVEFLLCQFRYIDLATGDHGKQK